MLQPYESIPLIFGLSAAVIHSFLPLSFVIRVIPLPTFYAFYSYSPSFQIKDGMPMTHVTPRMSNPLDATSVAISILAKPVLKSSRACSRSTCSLQTKECKVIDEYLQRLDKCYQNKRNPSLRIQPEANERRLYSQANELQEEDIEKEKNKRVIC